MLYTTRSAYKTLKSTGIKIDSDHVKFIDQQFVTSLLGERISSKVGFLPNLLLPIFLSNKIKHVHLVHDPGKVTTVFSFFSRLLPPFSLTVADSRNSYNQKYVKWLKNAYKIDCLSQSIADQLSRRFMEFSSFDVNRRITISPCSFAEYPDTISEWNERNIDVVFAGRFTKGKGLELLSKLQFDPEHLNIHILGEPGLPPHGFFPEIEGANTYFVPNIQSVLAKTKIFLSIQEVENYPSQSLLEAMGSGCAIIATNVGETSKLVDTNCGILIPFESKHLESSIHRLLSDPILCRRLGENSSIKVREKFTVESFSKYFLGTVASSDI